MLVVLATLGGFAWVNMYLTFDLYNVVVLGQTGRMGDAPADCQTYYCDASPRYYVHNYAAFQMCNYAICGPLCLDLATASTLTYDCPTTSDFNTNPITWYNCYERCSSASGPYKGQVLPYPMKMLISFYVGSVGGCLFGVAFLISFIYSLVGCCGCGTTGISCAEGFAIFCNWFCPSAKYFAFRQREDWEKTRVSFRAMLWVDIVVSGLIALSLGCYIYLAVANGFLRDEYLLTLGIGLMLLGYAGNLHRNYNELITFQDRLDRLDG